MYSFIEQLMVIFKLDFSQKIRARVLTHDILLERRQYKPLGYYGLFYKALKGQNTQLLKC